LRQNLFKLGDRFKIFRAAGRALGLNQLLKAKAQAFNPEQSYALRVRKEIVVSSAASDFAQQINCSKRSAQNPSWACFLLPARASKFFGKLLQSHQLDESLFDRESKIFNNQPRLLRY
jgi:hypothetical protein